MAKHLSVANSISTVIAEALNVRWGTNTHTHQYYLFCHKCIAHEWFSEFMDESAQLKAVHEFCQKHRHEEPKMNEPWALDAADSITTGIRTSFRVDVNQDLIIAIAKASNFNVNYQQNGYRLRLFCSKCQASLPLNRAITTSEIENTGTEFSKFCSAHAHRTVAALAGGRKFREDEP